ncbi:hypothetical protein HZB89_00125 [archaeon]|nr:hypothetical protein [archaeon]
MASQIQSIKAIALLTLNARNQGHQLAVQQLKLQAFYTCIEQPQQQVCPVIESISKDECAQKGGYVQPVYENNCIARYECIVSSTTQQPTQPACPATQPIASETDKATCVQQNGVYQAQYDSQNCVTGYYCALPATQPSTVQTKGVQGKVLYMQEFPVSQPSGFNQQQPFQQQPFQQQQTGVQQPFTQQQPFVQQMPQQPFQQPQQPMSQQQPFESKSFNVGPVPMPFNAGTENKEELVCSKEKFVENCISKSKEQFTSGYASTNVGKICELETKLNIKQLKRFCTDVERGKEDCVKQAEQGCEMVQKQLDNCKENSGPEAVKKIIQKKTHEMCTYSKFSKVQATQQDRLFQASNVLGQAGASIGGELKPWLEGEQSRLIDVTENVNAVQESDKQKDIIYALTKLIGMQQQREQQESDKLLAQVSKLDATISSLKALVGQVEDETVKATLNAQIADLEARRNEIKDSAVAKQSGASGIFSFLASFFAAQPQQPQMGITASTQQAATTTIVCPDLVVNEADKEKCGVLGGVYDVVPDAQGCKSYSCTLPSPTQPA